MDQTTYKNLLFGYRNLYDTGKLRLEEFKNYLSTEIKIDCKSQSGSSIEYFLFGQKLRTELQCSFPDIRLNRGFLVTYTEVEDEDGNCTMFFNRERWFDDKGNVERGKDYPAGYFLEIFDSFRKRFSDRRLNLVSLDLD